MNKIILQLLVLGFCLAIGQALQCYRCQIGVWGICITTKISCVGEEHCYSGEGTAVRLMDIQMKGCLEVPKCNKTTEMTLPGSSNSTVYTMTKTCCDTDLCNGAPGLPGASGLSLGLATLTALLMAQVLV